eukprot:Gb_31366 [translate_table: standard]
MTMAQNKMSRPRAANPPRSGGPSSHFAMIELKQRILSSLSKLGDRDTQQIAMEDLEKIIETLSSEGISVCLNCLYDTDFQQKGVVRKECVKFLGTLSTVHADAVSPHLTKIITHIVKRLKDPDSSVRDACQTTMGVLAGQYLRATGRENGTQVGLGLGSVVAVFVKPLFEALGEQNKSVQTGSAMCLAKVIENAKDPPLVAFQRLCPRICKYLSNPNFLAKASLLSVIGSLAQVGAISQQYLSILMPCINESLESTDWATRKAAAETLSRMATHSSQALTSSKSSTIAVLEACRFDKVKPVRDSMVEALQLWKNIPGPKDDSNSAAPKPTESNETVEATQTIKKLDIENSSPTGNEATSVAKVCSNISNPPSDSLSNTQSGNILEKTVGILKKRAPALTDKELNPDFFQKLETRGSDDWQVEVAVPRGRPPSVQSQHEEESEDNIMSFQERSGNDRMPSRAPNGAWQSSSSALREGENLDLVGIERRTGDTYNGFEITDDFPQDQWIERRGLRNKESKSRATETDDWSDLNQRDAAGARSSFSRSDSYVDGQVINGKGNWLVIQRQLSQLEHQQANLMEMLQDFMGNSQDSMLSLENRVRGLERVVEDMARDLAVSAGRRGGSHIMGYEGPINRSLNKYYGASDYPSPMFGKGNDGRGSFSERFTPSDVIASGVRGARESSWRSSDAGSDIWDSYAHGTLRNGHLPDSQMNSRRGMIGVSNDGRSARQEHHDGEQFVNRRAWDRGSGPARLGEGPSARSVWQASKDEATLAAIRVAGEDAGTSRASSRVAVPELNAEGLQYNSTGQGKGPFWSLWTRAMDCLQSGDIDSAYGEVLFTGDELLLVRLMSRSGPVLDQLSTGTVSDVLHAIGQLLQQQNFFDFGIHWIQQVADMVAENGPDCLGLSLEAKKELLLSIQESSGMEFPEDWEGNTVDELLLQLASAWSINLQQNGASN